MRAGLPQGTVTFVFTDIAGSTRLLLELGEERYAEALAVHRRVIRDAALAHDGVEVDTQGDAFFLAFPTADGAVAAAIAAATGLEPGPIRVRMGIHTGTPFLTEEGYVGHDVHLAARIAAVAHGGQIVLSGATAEAIGSPDGAVTAKATADSPGDWGRPVVRLTSLGEHRLKDFAAAVVIHQVGSEPFPPLRSLGNVSLPTPVSSFIGRESDVAAIQGRIREGARLVTLTGPGGTGKTRLAIAAARGLRDSFPAGITWVGLAAVREAGLVLPTIAGVLGVEGDLAAAIGARAMLIVLDNVEQVAEAAPDLAALLAACPGLALLTTSRVTLRIGGERAVPVDSLPLEDAIALFVDRSGLEATPDVEALCARLDALPLAVELAAARARLLGVRAVLDRLGGRLDLLRGGRDLDPRQQTLRATIAWSDELLDPAARSLFRQLSIFVGGCSLETAEEVLAADLDVLQTLLEHSLVRSTNGRFWMLETIRAYAAEGLAVAPDRAAVEAAFVAWALAFVEREDAFVRGPAQLGALERLDREIDNIRAAFALAVAAPEPEPDVVRRFAIASRWWLERRGFVAESRAWTAAALDQPDGDLGLRGWTLLNSATWDFVESHEGGNLARLEEASRLGEAVGDRVLVGSALENLGFLDDGPAGQARMEEAARIFAALGRDDQLARVTINLAARALNVGNDANAIAWFRDGAERAGALGNLHGLAMARAGEASGLALSGRAREAVDPILEAVAAFDAVGERSAFTWLLETTALVVGSEGLTELAQAMLESVAGAYERAAVGPEPSDLRLLAAARAALPDRDERAEDDASRATAREIEPRDLLGRWLAESAWARDASARPRPR